MLYLKHSTIFFILLLGSFVHISSAQTQNASIFVKVTNQLDEAITDAEINLIESKRTTKQTKADGQGVARFSNLTVGKYQIIVIASGFKEYKSETLVIKAGENKTVSIVLEIAPVESKVDVGGETEADADNFGTTRILRQETIDKLPDNPADLERVLRQIAGQSVTGEDLPITVDGFSGGKLPPEQAIQQIRINQNIFSAQYEGPYGGGVEIFTKSDIEKFSGSIGFNFANSRFNAANPYINQRLPSQTRGYNLYLSGPLISKKASFILYANHSENDSSTAVNAVILDSVFQPNTYKRFFVDPSRLDSLQFSIKTDLTKKHKISFNYDFNSQRSIGQGVGGFSLPSRAYSNNNQDHTIQLSDTYLANENIVSQTRFQVLYSTNKSFGGSDEAAINVLGAFSSGGSQIDDSVKDLHFELFNDTT
ncbi:MAG: carboxypeptidase regulatory-like domain-containing protein [Pyrinomonadaceae bacterium]